MIRTPPASDAYRDNWERVFAKPAWKVGDRATWHYAKHGPPTACGCDRHGTVDRLRTLTNGRVMPDLVTLDDGAVIDPTVSPEELTHIGAPCPWDRP